MSDAQTTESFPLATVLARHTNRGGVWPSCMCGWMDYRPRVSPLMTHADHLAGVVEGIVADRLAVARAEWDDDRMCGCGHGLTCQECQLAAVGAALSEVRERVAAVAEERDAALAEVRDLLDIVTDRDEWRAIAVRSDAQAERATELAERLQREVNAATDRLAAVEALVNAARPGLSMPPLDCTNVCQNDACNCSGNFRATAWTLDPEAVRAALYPPAQTDSKEVGRG